MNYSLLFDVSVVLAAVLLLTTKLPLPQSTKDLGHALSGTALAGWFAATYWDLWG